MCLQSMQENTPMRIILLFLAIISMSTTCKKQAGEETGDLEGKWMKMETLVSPGNIGEWEKYEGPGAYLIISNNGEVEAEGATVLGKNYNRYKLNGNYITFYIEASTDSLPMTFRFERERLIISPLCIEPCGIKLKRID